jgi:muconolactone delta-isomerase
MLFHVTMTHTADNCPGYEREKLAELVAASEKWDALARELNARVHFVLWGAPEHVAYALIEADSPGAVARYVNAIPIRQEFKVTPVQHLQETMTMAKAMLKS